MFRYVWVVLALGVVVACGGARIGETCVGEGAQGNCEAGAVCTITSSDSPICRKGCEENLDCETDEICSPVPDSDLKSCQPA